MIESLKQLQVLESSFAEVRTIFERYHYKGGHMGGGILMTLKVVDKDAVVGGVVIGLPRHTKKYPSSLEIRRMALIDELPHNSETFVLAKTIAWIRHHRPDIKYVLSYSDKSVGHIGTIYRAANFTLVGETSPSLHVFWNGERYHPRSLTTERPYSYKLREAVKSGEAQIIKGEPKLIFIYYMNAKEREATRVKARHK